MKKIIALLVVFIAALVGWRYYADVWAPAQRSAASGPLTAFGNVEIRESTLSFRVGGRIGEVLVEEGDRVSKGDVLATLEKDYFEVKLALARSTQMAAEVRLSKLRAGYEHADIRVARSARAEAATRLRNAEANFKRFSDLYSQNVVSQKEFEDVATARDQLRAAYEAAEAQYERVSGGFRTEDIEAAEALLEMENARVDEAKLALDDATLHSPVDGRVITRVSEVGTTVAPGTPVIAVMHSTPVFVRAYISERDLSRVHVGSPAKITTEAFGDDVIVGSVSFISPEAEFTPKQVQTVDLRADLVYRIRVRIDEDPKDLLRNGMPVTVEIE